MNEAEQVAGLKREYAELAHAMQSGVAMEMNLNDAHTPKHLRVGVNSALVDCGSLATLLLEKGVITELEYFTALRDGMKREVEAYERRLQDHYGRAIGLA